MPITPITSSDQFEKFKNSGKAVVIFSAKWCGPCKALHPDLEKYSEKYSSVKFGEVDVDELVDVVDAEDISSMPTLKFYGLPEGAKTIIGAVRHEIINVLEKFSK